jgi:hypothetical protein
LLSEIILITETMPLNEESFSISEEEDEEE